MYFRPSEVLLKVVSPYEKSTAEKNPGSTLLEKISVVASEPSRPIIVTSSVR